MERSKTSFASNLLGMRVRNTAGEDIGKIEDVVINPATGQIQYAVISLGWDYGTNGRLIPTPWALLNTFSSNEYVLLNLTRERLERAPAFSRNDWQDLNNPDWQGRLSEYYRTDPPVRDRTVYVERPVAKQRREFSLTSGILMVVVLMGLLWFTYLVSTRGWDQARNDVSSTVQGAAYAMKETSADAALTAKVKTALSLSKRVPADRINVDTENGVVTLRGEVAGKDVHTLAESIVRDIPGVSQVHNHLFVIGNSQ